MELNNPPMGIPTCFPCRFFDENSHEQWRPDYFLHLTSLGAASGPAAFYYHDRRPPSGGITPDQVFYPDLTC